jgi:hypothetical protein
MPTLPENNILSWWINIDIDWFVKKDKEKFKYLNNIFWNKIEYWDEFKIKKVENYFSIILWKNWVWKSSFIEYLINYYILNSISTFELMYITFSPFDNVKRSSKKDVIYLYNWLKSKTNWTVKSAIYNDNKIKILKYLELWKYNEFWKLISYIYWKNINIEITFNINDTILIEKLSSFDLEKSIDFEIFYKKTVLKLKSNKDKFLKILKNDLEKYKEGFIALDLESCLKLENIQKPEKKLKDKIKDFQDKKLFIYDNMWELEIKTLIIFSKIYIEIWNFNYIGYKELYNNKFYKINGNIDFIEFITKLNSIRKINSWTQAVNIDFWFHKDNDFFSLSNSSSWELILLYTFLHLSDFYKINDNKDYKINNNKKIILIDEPENSLHPQWQRDYIEKINQWLDILWFKNCFFIIVTHSPLIILWSQEKNFNIETQVFEKKYNVDVYWFKKDKKLRTISKKIDYISMSSIDEVLWDDFWVDLYSNNYKQWIKDRYDFLKWKNYENNK